MSREALPPLYHPFESAALEWPKDDARVLNLGARADLRPPRDFAAKTVMVQGFRPEFTTLERASYEVVPEPTGDNYDLALIVASRHRGESEMMLADAIARVRPGGLIVMAGGKTEGISSLRKRLSKDMPLGGHLSKNHGEVFWLQRAAEADAWALSINSIARPIVDGRFLTLPGMFSHDRLDAGSQLLAEILPTKLSGRAADFCAGWGYLSTELAARAAGITAIELFEADFRALETAKVNMAALAPQIDASFHWTDLATEKVERRFDVIVMNPPFHQGRAADPGIGQAMIRAASDATKPNGQLFMVANRGLPYQAALAKGFRRVEELVDRNGFRVWRAVR